MIGGEVGDAGGIGEMRGEKMMIAAVGKGR